MGAATSSRVHDDAAEAAEQEREDLAQVGPGHVHRHRQQRGEDRPDRVAGQQQAGQRRRGRPAAEAEDDAGRQQRPGEREAVEQAELEDDELDREQDRDRRAERRAGRRAEHVRVGQRVAEQALERGTGDGQPGPDDHRRQDPRQSQVPDDRLGGRRPRHARGRARASATRMTPSVSAGPMRTVPRPTPSTSSTTSASATRPADDDRPGPDARPATPAVGSARGRSRRRTRVAYGRRPGAPTSGPDRAWPGRAARSAAAARAG